MKIERCPVCKSLNDQELRFINLKDNFGFVPSKFDIVKCHNCDCLYLQNPIEKKYIHNFLRYFYVTII